jgi:hypothetical protein
MSSVNNQKIKSEIQNLIDCKNSNISRYGKNLMDQVDQNDYDDGMTTEVMYMEVWNNIKSCQDVLEEEDEEVHEEVDEDGYEIIE